MGATITLDGLIVLLSIVCVTCPAFILSRHWILRNRPTTAASIITNTSVLLFGAMLLTAAGLIMTDAIIEKRLRRTLKTDAEIMGKLATKEYLQRFFTSGLLYTTELWLLKVSFLGYFANLRKHFSPRANILYTSVCVYTAVTYVVILGFQVGYCQPVSRNWSTDPTKQCFPLKTLPISTLQAMLNVSADILVLVVALIVISSLKLNHRERYALFFVAAIGSVSIIMCLIRFVQVYQVIMSERNGRGSGMDVVRQLYVWGTLETNFAIAAFCLPAYRVFLAKHFKSLTTMGRSGKGSSGSHDRHTIGGGLRGMGSHGMGSKAGMGSRKGVTESTKGRIRVDDTVQIEFENDSETELNTIKPWERGLRGEAV